MGHSKLLISRFKQRNSEEQNKYDEEEEEEEEEEKYNPRSPPTPPITLKIPKKNIRKFKNSNSKSPAIDNKSHISSITPPIPLSISPSSSSVAVINNNNNNDTKKKGKRKEVSGDFMILARKKALAELNDDSGGIIICQLCGTTSKKSNEKRICKLEKDGAPCGGTHYWYCLICNSTCWAGSKSRHKRSQSHRNLISRKEQKKEDNMVDVLKKAIHKEVLAQFARQQIIPLPLPTLTSTRNNALEMLEKRKKTTTLTPTTNSYLQSDAFVRFKVKHRN